MNAIITAITTRISANRFDPARPLPDTRIRDLAELATRAPTAYNLQNWRLIAVRSAQAKARLREIAHGQRKVSEAAVVYILCGQAPSHRALAERLRPSVAAGIMTPETATAWTHAVRDGYGDAQAQRDEAIRSASLAAGFLIFAAQAHGLASCPMVGFDAERLAREFALAPDEIPVMLLAVGHAGAGNWSQKPRLPVAQILTTL